MLNDSQLILSEAQAITADAPSTNVIDMKSAGAGEGAPLAVRAHVNETFNNLTSLDIDLQCDADEAFGSVKSLTSRTVAAADLVAGNIIDLGVIPSNCEQYFRLNYDVNGTNPGAGQITAYVQPFAKQSLPNVTV